ncbi:hypothetical protein HAX54_025737 [Datura stramonium]|uniref:Uncharacterized protein n=1 Tax=Datura stramonium TaxID=4076 RepID=A0ABS8V2P6_DATST|nr:hypothetical protein [Datura stramonium]
MEEPSCLSPSLVSMSGLTYKDQTQSASSEPLLETLSPSPASPDLPSSPKWDGTLQELNILGNPIVTEDSEDEQPLSWKEGDEIHGKAIDEDVVVRESLHRSKAIAVRKKRKQLEVSTEVDDEDDAEGDAPDLPQRRKLTKSQAHRSSQYKGPGKSLVSDLITSQEKSNAEIEHLKGFLAQKKAEIVQLKPNPTEEPGLVASLCQENEELKAEVYYGFFFMMPNGGNISMRANGKELRICDRGKAFDRGKFWILCDIVLDLIARKRKCG